MPLRVAAEIIGNSLETVETGVETITNSLETVETVN